MNIRAKLLVSFCVALLISIAYVVQENCPGTILDDMDIFVKMRLFDKEPIQKPKDALFLDMVYDRQPVKYFFRNDSIYDLIVDKRKLLEFLKVAERLDTYKCIFLDITFDERHHIDSIDNDLLSQIKLMNEDNGKSVILVRSEKEGFVFDESYKDYAQPNDYQPDLNMNYTRDIFLQEPKYNSVALTIYNSIHEKEIHPESFLWFSSIYVTDNCIFRNNPILKIPRPSEDKYFRNYYLFRFMQLDDSVKARKMDNKVIFVGDFVKDVHGTYAGQMSGPYLTYVAYKSLENGKHLLRLDFLGIMFLIYFVIAFFLIDGRLSDWFIQKGQDFFGILNKRCVHLGNKLLVKIVRLLSSLVLTILELTINFLSFVVVLSFISILLYNKYDFVYSTIIPIIIFTLLKLVVNSVRSYNKNLLIHYENK